MKILGLIFELFFFKIKSISILNIKRIVTEQMKTSNISRTAHQHAQAPGFAKREGALES